jgi:hypothetical protein
MTLRLLGVLVSPRLLRNINASPHRTPTLQRQQAEFETDGTEEGEASWKGGVDEIVDCGHAEHVVRVGAVTGDPGSGSPHAHEDPPVHQGDNRQRDRRIDAAKERDDPSLKMSWIANRRSAAWSSMPAPIRSDRAAASTACLL